MQSYLKLFLTAVDCTEGFPNILLFSLFYFDFDTVTGYNCYTVICNMLLMYHVHISGDII